MTVVPDVGDGINRTLTIDGVFAGRVPLHHEEVEPALIAIHVRLLTKIGAPSPRATRFAFPSREVEEAVGLRSNGLPPFHRLLRPLPQLYSRRLGQGMLLWASDLRLLA
jgi:hypothetical protein